MKKFWKGVALAISLVLAASFAGCSSDGEEEEGKITSVTITESSLTLVFDDETSNSATLTATVVGTASDKTVNWTTSNGSVATVSNDGTVTAVAEGSATITATSKFDSSKYAVCEVTVISEALKNLAEKSAGTYTIGETTIVISSDGKISATDSAGNAVEVSVDFSDDTVTITVGENIYTASLTEEGGIDTSSVKDSDGTAVEVEYKTEGDSWIDDDTLTLVGTAWFNASNGKTSDLELDAGASVTYIFKVAADGADCLVEANDSAATALYLSTTSQKTAWGPENASMEPDNAGKQELNVLKAGNIYAATVMYDGSAVTITYYDLGTDGSESTVLFTTKSIATLTAPIKARFVAEAGTFYVKTDFEEGTKTLESIKLYSDSSLTTEISSTTSVKTFTTGSKFSADGVYVVAVYDNGTKKDVTSSAKFYIGNEEVTSDTVLTISSGETEETKVVTVKYTDDDVTQSATYTVTVTDAVVLSKITLDTSAATTTFVKGASFSSEGVTVTATYSDGNTKTVTDVTCTGYTMTTAGMQTVTVSYTEAEVTKTATYSIVVQEALPYAVSGTIAASTEVSPVAVTSTTGASVSFWLDLATAVTDATYEWESPLKITDGSNTIWIDVGPLGIWLSEGGANIFEGSATRGSDYTADNWTLFCQDGNAQYVTINFDTDGNITYYKNGLAALTYAASTAVADGITVATGCAKAIEILASNGCVLAATLDDAEYSLYDAYVTSALTADEAKERFLSAFSTIEIDTTGAAASFAKNDTFSASGISVTGTDSQNVTFALSSYATVDSSAVDMTTAGEYTVTCGSESATYTVKVNDISLSKIALTTTDVQTRYYTDGTHVPVLSTDNLVITATYSDSSTATIDASNADVSSLTATTGTQTVTVTYGGQSASYDVTVSSLTESAASWSGDITGGAWWTVFAENDLQAESGKSFTTKMKITAVNTDNAVTETDGVPNYQCAPCVILRQSDSIEYAVVRADNYGWGKSYGSATLSSDWDWDNFSTYINGSTLTVTVCNYGDGIADIKYDFTKTVDDTTTTHYQYYTGLPITASNAYVNLCFQYCNATFE